MEEKNKQRIMATVLGLVMLFSIAGFAGLQLLGRAPTDQNTYDFSNVTRIIHRQLEPNEVLYVLQSGRVLIQYEYTSGCADCLDTVSLLESLANSFPSHIVLEEVTNDEIEDVSLKMTGGGGSIVELKDVSEETLLDTFCNIAAVKPRECLLRELE